MFCFAICFSLYYSVNGKSTRDIRRINLSSNQSVVVSSPGNPRNYPDNINITWFIEVNHGNSAILDFTVFDLEAGYDYLTVGFGNDSSLEESRLIKLSGNTLPTEINTRHRTAWMEFVTDSATSGEGFVMQIHVKEDYIDFSPLTSFSISNDRYSNNCLVSYIIVAAEGSYLVIKVVFLQTEYRRDILFIGEGTEVGKRDTIRDIFTRDLSRRRTSVESQSRQMWVMFVSDYQNYIFDGFQLEIQLVTPTIRLYSEETVTIYSTNELEYTFNGMKEARWSIESPNDTVMHVRFLEFNLNIVNELVYVVDGLRSQDRERYYSDYTGDQLPPDFVSLSNRMTIVFAAITDTSNGSFVLNVTARMIRPGDVARVHVSAGETVYITSPNYPNLHLGQRQRILLVDAPEGYVISVRFMDLWMPNDMDGIEIGHGVNSISGGSQICYFGGPLYDTTEELFYSDTNGIYIRFHSNPATGDSRFKLEIFAVTLPIVLGVNLYHELLSPFYPMLYENNAFIEWSVAVPTGYSVIVYLIRFHLYDDEDVLLMGKGSNSSDKDSVTHRLTGLVSPTTLGVWSDRVWIRFSSDSFGIAGGFKIKVMPMQGEGHCLIPLGMESGWIPDSNVHSKSQIDSAHIPSHARLHGPSSWIPDPEVRDRIEVIFDTPHYITGMLIQGGRESKGTWIESIEVTFEDTYKEIISLRWNPEVVSLILLSQPRLGSRVRLEPSSKDPRLLSLRFEVLGCQSGCNFNLGLASGSQMARDLGLLPFEHRPRTGRAGGLLSNNTSVEVFLESSVIVRSMIIQQCHMSQLFSLDITVISEDSSHTFDLDISDCETAMCKVFLPEDVRVTRYTITPTDWDGEWCFRIELMGCHSVECASEYCEDNCSSTHLSPEVAREISMDPSRIFPPRSMCQQDINLPEGKYVVLIVKTAVNYDNSDGIITVSDMDSENKLSSFPVVFVSSSSNLSMTLLSGLLDSSVTTAYGSVDTPGCNEYSCKGSSGFVMSPGYLNRYANDLDLSWDIATKTWTQISLHFIELDVRSLDEYCDRDYLVIIDPPTNNILGKFCDRNKPSGMIMSSTNRMQIKFHTNFKGGGDGFLAAYSTFLLAPDFVKNTGNFTCFDDWDPFQGFCYRLFINSQDITWNEAERICQQKHEGHLVSIRDQDEMIFLHYMISSYWENTDIKTYIGLGSRDLRGVFHWNDGTPMSYTDWYIPPQGGHENREPNGGSLEACTMLVFNTQSTDVVTNLWHDVACASPETKQFICETPAAVPVDSSMDCGSGLFKCTAGECISKVFVCDGNDDCHDASDEVNCQGGCTSDQFKCIDGPCISISFYCDSIPHCLDTSDERECAPLLCTEDEFACSNGQCIPNSKRCDFIDHCLDVSDEESCVLELSPSAFQCYDGSLFPRKIQCDGIIDCIGKTNEDEHGCRYITDDLACLLESDIRCNNGVCAPNTSRCLYEFDEYGFLIGCRDVTHLRECGDFECPVSYLKCPSSYCIPLRYRCDGKWDCPFGDDEAFCDNPSCPVGSYRCHNQLTCITLDHVCDDVIHCPEQDDEQFCGNCSMGCQCDGLSYSCNLESVDLELFPRQLRKLSLNCNESAEQCNLSFHIVSSDDVTIGSVNSLKPDQMPYLIDLNLESSSLVEIHRGSFLQNHNILRLNLAKNRIRSLSRDTFNGLHRMKLLNLSWNPIKLIEVGTFANLTSLREIDLRRTRISFTENTKLDFTGVKNLEKLHSDHYVVCCFAGLGDSEGCDAPRDQFSSCEELMANTVLRIFNWILGGSAFVGNAFVISYRVFNQRNNRKTIVQSSFITNLAVSDFMMGLYMMTIASADIYYRGNYAVHADEWQSSTLCKMAGMLSVISSEASVLFIMMISIDRSIHVLLPFKLYLHISPRRATYSQLFIWCIAVVASAVPVVIPAYHDSKFYGQSGVCLALPLTVDRFAGWHYSIVLFIGANFVAFLITLLCYAAIFIRYQQSKQTISKTGNLGGREAKRLAEDIKLASKMALIVGTDLICWLPIIVMGLLSTSGRLTISAQVYAWTAVFILPVNSSLNPYLYTLSSMRGKKRKAKKIIDNSSTGKNMSMETNLRDDRDNDSSSFRTTPLDNPPLPIVDLHRLETWLKGELRYLTPEELEIIRRDVGQSRACKSDARAECFDNIVVRMNGDNRINQVFVLLDSNVASTGLDEKSSDFPDVSNHNISAILSVLEEIREGK